MKKYLLCLLFFCNYTAFSQHLKHYTVGDVLPDICVEGVRNHSTGNLKLSDYKNKIVILDFVGTNCTSCIKAFPHLQKLQEKYKDRLQIIVVNRNDTAGWQKLISRNKIARELRLPLVLADTLLNSCFPHEFVPHEVWLDGNRKVIAITTAQYIREENIEQVLRGNKINWPVKKDLGYYDFKTPLVKLETGEFHQPPVYYSIFTGHRMGTLSARQVKTDTVNHTKTLTIINTTLPVLIQNALKNKVPFRLTPNRYLFENLDRDQFFYDSSKYYFDQWERKYGLSYELVLPSGASDEQVSFSIISDLYRYRNISVTVEKRRVECLVLKTIPGSEIKPDISSEKPRFKSTDAVVSTLNLVYSLPVLNETGMTSAISLPDPAEDLFQLEKLNKYLGRYGFVLMKAEREVEMVVVKRVGNGNR